MKFSYSWLTEHLKTNAHFEEIEKKLTSIGLEVEDIQDTGKAYQDFIVGQVLEEKKHPNADKLKLCKVDIGKEKVDVVCGAPNVEKGMKVVYAPVGSTIPVNQMKIKAAKIRGVESYGMMCSEYELGISNEHDGIIRLEEKETIGRSFSEIYGSNDIVIEEISFSYDNSNAQPSLVSTNGLLSLTWISSDEDMNASLNFRQFKDENWTDPQTFAVGSDWFVNWADFPTHAISGDQVLTSYLKKSASGTYTYDVFLSLHKLSGEKIKKDFILNTDGFKAEHGFVSIVAKDNDGFFVTWLDGRNTVKKDSEGNSKPMTIRFAEITNAGDIINETELDSSVCDCCQTSMTFTDKGPLVVYRDRSKEEVRDIYVTRNIMKSGKIQCQLIMMDG